MNPIDASVAACLVPLAIWVVVSGLDDLFIDLVCWFRASPFTPPENLDSTPEKRIALFVPLWREDRVIAEMLEHNARAIRYANYEVFAGCYPNDRPTIEAVRRVERTRANVHAVICPHDGPTSKADCLNWVYQRMLRFEEETGARFDLVVVHDAEDLIHPNSLKWINGVSRDYDMIQVPVLPLATPLGELTHGVYCDEFAATQTRDLPVRQALGGFIPSCGVGTGFTREALALLAAGSGRLFDAACLTEDYEIGLRLRQLRCRQLFLPLGWDNGQPVATREYFPRRFRDAVRQRTRWVTGIALQCWERHGWGTSFREAYWFWRDRKGLIGNPLSFLANLFFLYGLSTWTWSQLTGGDWGLARRPLPVVSAGLFDATLALLVVQTVARAACSWRVYGARFAAGAPFRVVWGNWINCFATAAAVFLYLRARWRRQRLAWLKTEHDYPSRALLAQHRGRIGEILVALRALDPRALQKALRSKPAELRLGEHLLRLHAVTEEQLYKALGVQHGLPFGTVEPAQTKLAVLRLLPEEVARRWKVLPFRVEPGKLFLAGSEIPTEELRRHVRKHTRLEIRFRLVTPSNLAKLSRQNIKSDSSR